MGGYDLQTEEGQGGGVFLSGVANVLGIRPRVSGKGEGTFEGPVMQEFRTHCGGSSDGRGQIGSLKTQSWKNGQSHKGTIRQVKRVA